MGVGTLPFAGGERYSLRLLCAVGRLSGRHCTFTLPPTTQARFFGAPPRFFAQKQRNGVERAVGRRDYLPRKRRTRNCANEVPPFLWLSACAPLRWEVFVSLPCDSTPFLWCLPKETVSSRQRKALFYPGGSTIRVSASASVVFTHLRLTWGGGWWLTGRSSQLDAVGGDVGASSPWERRVGPNMFRGGTQARFFGAPPRFFAQEQRNGVERAAGATTHRPRKRRTRSGTKKEPFRALFYSIPIFFLNATGPYMGA